MPMTPIKLWQVFLFSFFFYSDAVLMHWQFPHDTDWPRPPICSVTWFSSAHPKKKKGEEKAAGRFSDTVFGIHSSLAPWLGLSIGSRAIWLMTLSSWMWFNKQKPFC